MGDDSPRVFGRYELLERIGFGGMAEVWRARMRTAGSISKLLVVKKILPFYARDREFLDMFRDEAKVALRLTHANIVQVFDFGQSDEEEWFLAMEFVHGRDLRTVAKALAARGHAAMPPAVAVHVAGEIARGLHHAHTRVDEEGRPLQIVHRDISPHNVLVSFDGEVKITDFGIAKARDRSQEKTQAGVVKGKLRYLAPEQMVGGDAVDARADLWALGATLWELLVGESLHAGASEVQVMRSLASADPFPPPSSKAKGIPAAVDVIVARAIAKDRRSRFQSAAEMTRAIAKSGAAAAVTDVDIAELMAWLFAEGPTPEILRAGETEETATGPGPARALDVPTLPRRPPVADATTDAFDPAARAETLVPAVVPENEPLPSSSFEIPLGDYGDEGRAGPPNTLVGHFRDAQHFLTDAYISDQGSRGLFLACDPGGIVLGAPVVCVVTFERPAARFVLNVKGIWKQTRDEDARGKAKPRGIAARFLPDGDIATFYRYLGLES